jgi:hypothetical protein
MISSITYNATEDRRSAGIGDGVLVHLNQIEAIRVRVGKRKEMIFERGNIVCRENEALAGWNLRRRDESRKKKKMKQNCGNTILTDDYIRIRG